MSEQHVTEQPMAEQIEEKDSDGAADVFAVIAIMTIVISTVVFWLKSM